MEVEPYDEKNIGDEQLIIRRVNPDQHVVPDENTGKMRTSSKLFSPSSEPKRGMSVDILSLIEEAGLDPRTFVTTPTYVGSVCFSAKSVRNAGLRVGYDPILENPYHGEVWGDKGRPNRFTNAQKRALAQASKWFVEIVGVDIGI